MERLELLYDISRKIGSSLDLDKVLSDILALTIPSVGATNGSIIVLDESGQARRHILIREKLPTPITEEVVAQVLDKGLAGWVVRHKEGTIIYDTRDDERWLALTEDHLTTRSAVAVPLLRQERVVGVLTLAHPEPNRFGAEHLDLLLSIANQAAIAVENARLYDESQQRLRELSVLYEVSQATSSLRLDETLRLIVEKTARALRADRCALFLLDEEREALVLRAVDNPDRPAEALGLRLPLTARPHVAEAIATRRPVEIPDIFADSSRQDFWPLARELNLRACLAVPLMIQEQVIGALSLDRISGQPPFSASEVALCQTIANQAAVAIENARLYEKVTERMREATALYKVSHQLMHTLNLDQVLEKVLDMLWRFFGYSDCAILLLDEETGELEVRAGRGYLRRTVGKVRLKAAQEGIVGWVVTHKTALNVPDVSQDARYVAVVPETKSEIAVPMIAGDQVIGVLDVQKPEVNAFSDDDLRLLSSIAAQAAIAIERARLYSAERRLHTAIAEERAKLEAIISGTNDAIIITDAQERVLLMNQAARRAFAVETAPEVGRPLGEVVSNERLLALFARLQASEEALFEEIPLSNGRTLYASLTPVAEVGRIAVMQDITYLKELDKMKSDFVSTVSHDLRSPLANISGYATLLLEIGGLNETQQEFVTAIRLNAAKMATLIDNLLDLGKIEARVGMEMKPCQLVTVINEAVDNLREQARAKEIVLQLDLPPQLPLVQGNRVRLDQVVSNLVSNAIKFTAAKGTVTISARERKGEVAVEVRDTGIGIAPKDQVHLFEKFYRVEATSHIEGTGLGLAIVKSIVEGHGGRVWVESKPGQGSTFGFALPVPSG